MLEENGITTKSGAFIDIVGLDKGKITGTIVTPHPQIMELTVVLRGTGIVQTSRSGYSGLGSAGFRKEPHYRRPVTELSM